jgi:anti-sigma regulatory factor (Ser/Thr protein kinase)
VCCDPVFADPAAIPSELRGQPRQSVHEHYQPLPQAVPAARRFVSQTTTSLLDDTDRYTAELLASELVTNAVLHARTPLQVGITSWPDRILVAVGDDQQTGPVSPAHDLDRPSGRGILLVEAMSQQWGFTSHAAGKTTWFFLPR